MAPELASIWLTQNLLGDVSRQTIYNLIATGRLDRVNLGRRAFITGASIDRLIAEMKSMGNGHGC